jgi:hypothetical protein
MRYLIILLLVLAACSPAPEQESTRPPLPATMELPATQEPTQTPAPTDTSAPIVPTATPMTVSDLPAIELLSAAADSCINEEDYGQVLGYNVHYYEVTTANRLHFRLEDAEGNVLTEADASGENKDGEEAWGFYPLAYEVPENSLLTFTLEVYENMEENAPLTSTSTIIYNCTTSEVTDSSFERMGQ